jgi:hypothetical protein
MRLGKPELATCWLAASNLVAGTIASSMGKATTVPNPLRNLRRGICHFLVMLLSSSMDGL